MHSVTTRIPLLVILALLPVGCRAGRQSPMIALTEVCATQKAPDEITQLHVKARVGSVTVIGDAEDEVRIQAKVKLRKSRITPDVKSGEFEDHVRVITQGNTLTVQDAHMDQLDEDDWGVSLVIHCPARLAVNMNTAVGSVRVDNMTGDMNLTTSVGQIIVSTTRASNLTIESGVGNVNIKADILEGPVKATSGTGSVALRVGTTPPTQDVTLATGTGSVQLDLPPDSPGSFELGTGTGSITIRNHKGLSITRSLIGASAEGTLGESGPKYELATGTGSIVLR